MKSGKAAGADNIPGELIKEGGPAMEKMLHKICQKVREEGSWPATWTKSLVLPLFKKGNIQLCQNYRTISLISHPSKVLLRIILNRLKPKVESVLSEEQAGFRKGRSTVEQICSLRIICEKYREHQLPLHLMFIDFKKAFDRVWHDALWNTMRIYHIGNKTTDLIAALYKDAKSAVVTEQGMGAWFPTTVGVRQGCLLSPILFNLFIDRIMQESITEGTEQEEDYQEPQKDETDEKEDTRECADENDEHEDTSVKIGGRMINSLMFADDIALLAGSHSELQEKSDSLNQSSKRFGMEISAEKTKTMTITAEKTEQAPITMNGKPLEQVETFTYLGANINQEGGSSKEIISRLAKTYSCLKNNEILWKSKNISIPTKIRILRALVISVFLYGCESWTLTAYLEKRISALEMICYRRLLRVSYKDHISNDIIREQITQHIGPHKDLLSTVKERKLKWFGHVTRRKSIANTIMHGTVRGSRPQGRPKKTWLQNIKDWTGSTLGDASSVEAHNRDFWRMTSRPPSVKPVPRRSLRSRDR